MNSISFLLKLIIQDTHNMLAIIPGQSDIASLVALFLIIALISSAIIIIRSCRKSRKSLLKHETILSELRTTREKNEQLNEAVATLKDQIETLNKIRISFVSNLQHELMTPLSGIINTIDLIEQNDYNINIEELNYYKHIVNKSRLRIVQLFNNISDISKMSENNYKLNLNSLCVNSIIKKYVEQEVVKTGKIDLLIDLSDEFIPKIDIDRESFKKVLNILLDNAMKFTKQGFVRINTGYNKEANEVSIKIVDTGTGISEEFLPYVFEMFGQEDMKLSRQYNGAGLGLYLAKKIVEQMNGRILIESMKNNGTAVTLFFPGSISQQDKERNTYSKKIDFEYFKN